MSGRCTGWVLKHGPRDRAMRAVLITIADAANSDGLHAHPGIKTMVEGSLYSRAHVLATIGRLIADGWLQVEEEGGGRGQATTYSVPMETVQPLDLSLKKGSNPAQERVQSEAETVQSSYLEVPPTVYVTENPTRLPPTGGELVNTILHEQMDALTGRRSWDLLREVFLPAYDRVQAEGTKRDAVALVVRYVAELTGEPVDDKTRSLIALTVHGSGKLALVGWDTALGATEKDDSRSRLAYARAVIKRTMHEMQSA